jgi:hypothetical protein
MYLECPTKNWSSGNLRCFQDEGSASLRRAAWVAVGNHARDLRQPCHSGRQDPIS